MARVGPQDWNFVHEDDPARVLATVTFEHDPEEGPEGHASVQAEVWAEGRGLETVDTEPDARCLVFRGDPALLEEDPA